MQLKAYNKRLKHTTDVQAIDFNSSKIKLIQPHSKPIFTYEELLTNVELLEFTGVTLGNSDIYEGDKVTNGTANFTVVKMPGGYYPFMIPVKQNFKKVQ